MRGILETCVELDRRAYETYRELARSCPIPELARVFEQMGKEERAHVEWWHDLLVAWEGGLLPDIADEGGLLERLGEIRAEVDIDLPDDFAELDVDEMLDMAAHLEFFMLDPLFGELTDLMRPGSKTEFRDSYSRHVMRLVEAIEKYHTRTGLAAFLARVLKRAYRDQQRLSQLAVGDQLTGILNRRGLLSHLQQWLSWSARYGHPVGIALLDVDHFKDINDEYGHPAGDEALKAIAIALGRTVRSSDVVGRFGGDEFMVLAPEADEQELQGLMERIVDVARTTAIHPDGEPVFVSVSVGGAWVSGAAEVSTEVIVAAADRSLYAAKESGRDRASHAVLVDGAAVV